jgi:methylglutaconyl-CoA hydratase
MFETVEIERDGALAWVWMNRPEVHNAFNARLIADLAAACRELESDPAVRVVILGGRGKSFSAGADIHWMKAAGEAGEEENFRDAMALAEMLRTLAELGKPTIARVHGAAFGGGMGLACACDICVVSEAAVFATSEVRFGIIPAAISPYVIRALGERQSYRYFQTAERIAAPRARELGLAHEVVSPEALDATVAQVAGHLLSGGPVAQAQAKALIRAVALRPIDGALITDTAQRISRLRATPEAREGLSAFLEKRAAKWVPAA